MSVYTRNKKLGNKSLSKKQSGFTLIEVLIGVFIAAVGIVGVLEIQKHVMRSGNEVNARIIAMQLVREKLDDINNIDSFEDVGVTPPPADEGINKRNYSFTRSWQMTVHHFDKDAATWGVVGAGESTDAKHVIVSVTWTDINNEDQVVNGEQIIARSSIHDTSGLSGAGGDRAEPNIPFTQLSTIENPPISLVDDVSAYPNYNTKETSKPVPTVDAQNGQNLIQFETITYDADSDKQTLDDFVTVNCACSFNGSGEAKAPTILTLSDDKESLINDKDSGETITKTVGTVSSSTQPALCTACCEEHHDSDLSSTKYVAGTSGGDHPHYSALLDTVVTSGDYVEACRFRRVDGFYEVVPDWQLADIIIMPKSYFYDDSNVATYVDYVKDVVKATVMDSAMPAKPDEATRNMTNLVTGTYQLIARGIYVDLASLSSTDLTTIQSYVSGTDYKPNWLEYVPFYEINLSLFADWATDPDPSLVASITNEDISTIVDPSTNYYGTYSKGWLTALATGNTDVKAVARTDNTGITGSGAIIPLVQTATDTINAAVNLDGGVACATGCKSIEIAVSCVKYLASGTQTTCTGQEGQAVNLTYSAGLTCTTDGTVTFPTYSHPNVICNGISSTWSSGWISLSSPDFKFYFPPVNPNPTPEEIAIAEAGAQTELAVYITTVTDPTTGVDELSFLNSVIMLKQ